MKKSVLLILIMGIYIPIISFIGADNRKSKECITLFKSHFADRTACR